MNISVPRKQLEPLYNGAVRLHSVADQIGVTHVRINYTPRAVFRNFHGRNQRFALTVAHRRCGKTVATVNDDIRSLLVNGRTFPPPQAAFISPTFAQSKRNAWPYAKHYVSGIPGTRVHEGDLTITLPNGGKYIFAGSDRYDSLRGLYLDRATLDEFGSQDPRVWGEVVRPALSDYGGSATFIGSAHGRNHFYDMLETHQNDDDWLITILKASQTGLLSKEELEAARKTMTDEQYRQEYECDFDAAVIGTFYGKELELAHTEGRIKEHISHERASDTYAGWDLGTGGACAIWVYQRVNMDWNFLAFYEGFKPDSGLQDAVDWVKSLPLRINEHFLPHDATVREQQVNTTRKEFLEQRGLNCTVLPRRSIAEGIGIVRVNFNKFFFDKMRCDIGLSNLSMYRSEYDDKRKVFSDRPVHDFASHAADALRYAVMGMPDAGSRSDWSKPVNREQANVY